MGDRMADKDFIFQMFKSINAEGRWNATSQALSQKAAVKTLNQYWNLRNRFSL
jgi:hypothetical protein